MNSDTKVISIIGIITVLVIMVGVMFAVNAKNTSQLSEIKVNESALVRANSFRVTGSNPKVQFVEFADFECPACAMLHPALKKIMAEYGDKIDFVFRVIPIHEHSILAASAVFAARDQSKFLEMHDIVFEKQDEWAAYGKKDAEISALFEIYAAEAGLDVARYKADLAANADKYKKIIEQDAADATAMGISSTPTGIINGKPLIRGVVTYDKLKMMIEAELNPQAATSTASATTSVATSSGPVSSVSVNASAPVSVTTSTK